MRGVHYAIGGPLREALRQSHRDSAEPHVAVVRDWRAATLELARARADSRRQFVRELQRGGCRVVGYDARGQRIRKLRTTAGTPGWATRTPSSFWRFLRDFLWP